MIRFVANYSLLVLLVAAWPATAQAAVDEQLIHRLMSRLSGAEALDDGTRITSRYVLRPDLLGRAAEELTKELTACGLTVEPSDFNVAVVDFTAAAKLDDRYTVFGENVLAYAASPTGPFQAESFPGTVHAALRRGTVTFAAGEFTGTQADRETGRWYFAPGQHLAVYQGEVFAAGESGAIYTSNGNAPFTLRQTTSIKFGGLAASDTALWAVSGDLLLRAPDGLTYTAVLQNEGPWLAVATVSGGVFALSAGGDVYDVQANQWVTSPWSGEALDGWYSREFAFRTGGDILFGLRAEVFGTTGGVTYAPVSPPFHGVVTPDAAGLLVAGRRGSLAYLSGDEVPMRIEAPAWQGAQRDSRFAVARNLILHRPGSKLLLSAHLDSIATNTPGWNGLTDPAPGADDDLSGVAALAAVACARPHSQVFDVLFTSGEEVGLAGSYWEALGGGKGYAYDRMLTVDEVGLRTRRVYVGFQDEASRAFAESLTSAVAPGSTTRFLLSGEPTLISRADHYAYYLKGSQAVILSAGVPPPSQYHTVYDTLDRTDVQTVIDTARLLERYVARLEPPPNKRNGESGCAAGGRGGWPGVLLALWLLARRRV